MDADKATILEASTSNEKDAVILDANTRERETQNEVKIQQTKVQIINEIESKETDELLEKIEEIVKDDSIKISKDIEDDISKASEQDFLKKIDEEMKDSNNDEKMKKIDGEKSNFDGVIVNKEIFKVDGSNGDDVTDKSNAVLEVENIKKTTQVEDKNKKDESENDKQTDISKNLNVSSETEEQSRKRKNINEESNKDQKKQCSGGIEIVKDSISAKTVSSSAACEITKNLTVLQKELLPSSLHTSDKILEPMCVDSNESSTDGKMELDCEEKTEMDVDDDNGTVVCNDQEMKSVENQVLEDMNKKLMTAENQFGKIDGGFKDSGAIRSETKEVKITVEVNVNTNPSNIVSQSVNKNVVVNKIKEQTELATINNAIEQKVDNNKTNVVNALSTSELHHQQGTELNANNKVELNKATESELIKSSQNQSSISENSLIKTPTKEIPSNKECSPKSLTSSETTKDNKETDNATSVVSTVTEKLNADDNNKIENKLLTKFKSGSGNNISMSGGSESLTNSPIPQTQANVFNSTPIAKQFEISSENVSKISGVLEHSTNTSTNSRCDHDLGEGTSSNLLKNQSKQQTQLSTTATTTTTTQSTTSESTSYCPTSETDQSSDGISKFISSIKNGMADSTTTTTDDISATVTKSQIKESTKNDEYRKVNAVTAGETSSKMLTDKPEENMYEINVWSEKNDIKFLSVEKLERNKLSMTIDKVAGGDSSGQGSSNGSVSSLPQFSLPQQRLPVLTALSSSGSTSESSEKLTTDDKFNSHLIESNKTKHLIKGLSELCSFMINHFTKIRTDLNPVASASTKSELTDEENTTGRSSRNSGVGRQQKRKSTPKPKTDNSSNSSGKEVTSSRRSRQQQQQRQSQSPICISDSSSPVSKESRSSKTSCESPALMGGKGATNEIPSSSRKSDTRTRKRSISKVISDDDDDYDGKSKSKQIKRTSQQQAETKSEKQQQQRQQQQSHSNENQGYCVLAKWIDKKYYAGRILEVKPPNKFVVRFEDGASKILQKDLIVFGNDNDTLPLKDHKIYALVDDDYESGIVTSIDKVDNKVLYTVKCETATVKVTASDIYLQDDQAKIIQNLQNSQPTPSSAILLGLQHQDSLSNVLDTSLTTAAVGATTATKSTRNTRQKRISGGSGSPITTITGVSNVKSSPEPGTSGSNTSSSLATKRGGKRQKRYS